MKHQNLSNNQITCLYNDIALKLGWSLIDSNNHIIQSR